MLHAGGRSLNRDGATYHQAPLNRLLDNRRGRKTAGCCTDEIAGAGAGVSLSIYCRGDRSAERLEIGPVQPILKEVFSILTERNIVAELQLLVEDVVIKSFPLDKTSVRIGRAQDNDIVLEEDAVSGNHARIDLIPNEYMDGLMDIFIEDLDSTNGTFVNGAPVKRQQLQNFDTIRIAWTDFKLVTDKGEALSETAVIVR